MVWKTISQGCGVQASPMQFLIFHQNVEMAFPLMGRSFIVISDMYGFGLLGQGCQY